MITPPNLTGVYETDVPALLDFFKQAYGQISLDNFEGEEIETTTVTASTDHTVDHNLGKVPRRFITIQQNKLASVIMITATAKTITIQSSVDAVKTKFFIE